MSNTRVLSLVAAGAMVLGLTATSLTAHAASTGVPGHPFGAGECTTYQIDGKNWSFRTVDVGNNALGRFTAVNDASVGKYSITVRVASEAGRPDVSDNVECINGQGQGILNPTPFAFN